MPYHLITITVKLDLYQNAQKCFYTTLSYAMTVYKSKSNNFLSISLHNIQTCNQANCSMNGNLWSDWMRIFHILVRCIYRCTKIIWFNYQQWYETLWLPKFLVSHVCKNNKKTAISVARLLNNISWRKKYKTLPKLGYVMQPVGWRLFLVETTYKEERLTIYYHNEYTS